MDAEAARDTGGVMGTAWGTAEDVGAMRGAAKVSEVGDEGAVKSRAVGPPGVADRQPQFHGQSDYLRLRSDRQEHWEGGGGGAIRKLGSVVAPPASE
jgi:hypothetical protein